jgi:hypothetical protein
VAGFAVLVEVRQEAMAYETPPDRTPSEHEERVARRETPRGLLLIAAVVVGAVLAVFLIALLI